MTQKKNYWHGMNEISDGKQNVTVKNYSVPELTLKPKMKTPAASLS